MKLLVIDRSLFADSWFGETALFRAGWLKECIDTAWRSGNRITTSNNAVGQADKKSCPLRGLGGWIVRAQHLCAARESDVGPSVIVVPRLFGSIVGPGSDQITLLGESVDLLFCSAV